MVVFSNIVQKFILKLLSHLWDIAAGNNLGDNLLKCLHFIDKKSKLDKAMTPLRCVQMSL